MTEPARRGALEAGPLLETLSVLARYRKTGLLTLRTLTDQVEIAFENGSVHSVFTNDDDLRIGQVLIELGHVTEEQIEQALALQSVTSDPDRIGEVLVDVGYISEAEINDAVARQIQAALVRLMRDRNGVFEFEPREAGSAGPSSYTSMISFEPIVLNATYLADRWLAEHQPENVNALPDTLIDTDVLRRLSARQRQVFQKLLDTYSHLHQLAWKYGKAAKQIKHSIERLLQHVLLDASDDWGLDPESDEIVVEHFVYLVDRHTDLWTISDLTRNARGVLLELLNGEWRLSVIEEQLSESAEMPERAVQELVSSGLICIDLVVARPSADGEWSHHLVRQPSNEPSAGISHAG